MAVPKRTRLERERDLERVVDLHCRGMTQRAIAEQLQVSQPQIAYDMKRLQNRWQESARAKLDLYKAEQLARIDHLEATAWSAWDASCRPTETTSAKLVQGRTDKDGQPLPDLRQSGKVTKSQAGDPRFLERAAWCIEQRCKIIGLHAPVKVAPTSPDGEDEYAKLTDDEAATGLEELLAILEARRLGPFAPEALVDPFRNGHSSPGGPNATASGP
jgi:hypothetical protein